MNAFRGAALVALLLGLGVIGYGAMLGDVRVGLFLIVPFVYGEGPLPFLGMLLLMAAMVLFVLGSVPRPPPESWTWPVEPPQDDDPARAEANAREGASGGRVRHGGVLLLGPIPIVWGSDRRVLP